MEVLKKPTNAAEVAQAKKSAKVTLLAAGLLVLLLILVTATGGSSKVLIFFTGISLGLGLYQWFMASKVEKELAAKSNGTTPPPAST